MVPLIIWGCIIMSFFFMVVARIIKGISALIETLFDMKTAFAVMLIGGAVILAMEILIEIGEMGFWQFILILVIGAVVIGIAAAFLGVIGSIFAAIFGVVVEIISFIFELLQSAIEFLGDMSEQALKFFLGTINKKISLS